MLVAIPSKCRTQPVAGDGSSQGPCRNRPIFMLHDNGPHGMAAAASDQESPTLIVFEALEVKGDASTEGARRYVATL